MVSVDRSFGIWKLGSCTWIALILYEGRCRVGTVRKRGSHSALYQGRSVTLTLEVTFATNVRVEPGTRSGRLKKMFQRTKQQRDRESGPRGSRSNKRPSAVGEGFWNRETASKAGIIRC